MKVTPFSLFAKGSALLCSCHADAPCHAPRVRERAGDRVAVASGRRRRRVLAVLPGRTAGTVTELRCFLVESGGNEIEQIFQFLFPPPSCFDLA